MSNTALSAAAVALSASALSEAESANRKTCEILIANYDGRYATVEQMQSYAQCVQLVHPFESGSKKQEAQVLILTCLICAAIGVVAMYRNVHTRKAPDLIFAAFLGILAGFCMFVVGTLIFWAFS